MISISCIVVACGRGVVVAGLGVVVADNRVSVATGVASGKGVAVRVGVAGGWLVLVGRTIVGICVGGKVVAVNNNIAVGSGIDVAGSIVVEPHPTMMPIQSISTHNCRHFVIFDP